jgi:hypothetical protein
MLNFNQFVKQLATLEHFSGPNSLLLVLTVLTLLCSVSGHSCPQSTNNLETKYL